MRIERRSIYEIPENAVIVTESEALSHYIDLINDRKYSKEAWPFNYGLAAQFASAGITSALLSSHYRRRLNTPQSGKLFFFIITGGPAALISMGVSLTVGVSLFFGLGPGAGLAFHIASTLGSCQLPIQGGKNSTSKTLDLYKQLTVKQLPRIWLLAAFNAALSISSTYKQYQSFERINYVGMIRERKLMELQADRDYRMKDPTKQ